MSRYLLDTNVLIALLDPDQQFHAAANRWFYGGAMQNWLSCPITENGTVRIVSLPQYPGERAPGTVLESLGTLLTAGNHERVADDVSLFSPEIEPSRIETSAQVTDLYLALLAFKHSAQLATFDRRISTAALRVPATIFQIPT